MGRSKFWAHWNYSFDEHLSFLEPVSCSLSPESLQGAQLWVAAVTKGLMATISFVYSYGRQHFSFTHLFSKLFLFSFLWPHLQYMGVPRLGVGWELQLPACATATTPNNGRSSLSCCSLWQCWIPNPLSKARNWTHILVDTIWVLSRLSHSGHSSNFNLRSLDTEQDSVQAQST